jgi:UDP-glucuronate 4-epimerase
MSQTVLITGGLGFIGHHCVKKFLDDTNIKKIIIIDNYDPKLYDKKFTEYRNYLLKTYDHGKKICIFQEDICDKDKMNEIFLNNNESINTVIHLAAIPGVRYSLDHPIEVMKNNISGTINILESCKKHKIKNVIIASSSSVYGNNQTMEKSSELQSCNDQISPYAVTKKICEEISNTYKDELKVIMLRFFTVYGPNGRPDMSILNFINKIHNNEKINVNVNKYEEMSSITREFTYVDDIVDGIKICYNCLNGYNKTFNKEHDGLNSLFEIINLGGGNTSSLEKLIKNIIKTVKNDTFDKNNYNKYCNLSGKKEGDVDNTCADITKAKKYGYNPKTKLLEGIKNTYKSYLEYVIHNTEKILDNNKILLNKMKNDDVITGKKRSRTSK